MDLYIFLKVHSKAVRLHLMIGNPRFGNFFSKNLEDEGFLWKRVLIDLFWNESYWEKSYSSGVERNHKCFVFGLLDTLRTKRFRKQQNIEYNKGKWKEGLGALFS